MMVVEVHPDPHRHPAGDGEFCGDCQKREPLSDVLEPAEAFLHALAYPLTATYPNNLDNVGKDPCRSNCRAI
jgi:hypothetical protein